MCARFQKKTRDMAILLNQFYSRETSALILMQCHIINICSVRIGVLYFICETYKITNTVMKQSKGLKGHLKPEHKKTKNGDHDVPDHRHW